VKPVLDRASQFDCQTWAREVIRLLSVNFAKDERLKILKPLTDRAREFLSHLLIASMLFHLLEILSHTHPPVARNPGGKKTPQQSVHSTPDMSKLRPILNLLEETTTQRSQSALMELVRYLLNRGWLNLYVTSSSGVTGLFVPSLVSLSLDLVVVCTPEVLTYSHSLSRTRCVALYLSEVSLTFYYTIASHA
jgi:hypothetical protein